MVREKKSKSSGAAIVVGDASLVVEINVQAWHEGDRVIVVSGHHFGQVGALVRPGERVENAVDLWWLKATGDHKFAVFADEIVKVEVVEEALRFERARAAVQGPFDACGAVSLCERFMCDRAPHESGWHVGYGVGGVPRAFRPARVRWSSYRAAWTMGMCWECKGFGHLSRTSVDFVTVVRPCVCGGRGFILQTKGQGLS